MRLRLPTGAVPLIPLATLAVCAQDPVADPGMVRISFEQRSSIEAGDAGGRGEQFMFGAQILAYWTVKAIYDTRRRVVCAIRLLSDGHPTGGPGADVIDRDVFRWGYLRGVRVVAASFTGDIAQPDNLCSRLARRWFGWVRALDAGALAQPPPPATVDDDD